MTMLIYNILAALVDSYRECDLIIVRAHESAELLAALVDENLENLVYVQLLSKHNCAAAAHIATPGNHLAYHR